MTRNLTNLGKTPNKVSGNGEISGGQQNRSEPWPQNSPRSVALPWRIPHGYVYLLRESDIHGTAIKAERRTYETGRFRSFR
jgi:hypothetical protein